MLKGAVLFAVLSVMPDIATAPEPALEVTASLPSPVEPPGSPLQAEKPLAAIAAPATEGPEEPHEVCREGLIVMIPDGREGRVTSREDGICRVLAYGEGYVSLWLEDMVEPVYPQDLPNQEFGH